MRLLLPLLDIIFDPPFCFLESSNHVITPEDGGMTVYLLTVSLLATLKWVRLPADVSAS